MFEVYFRNLTPVPTNHLLAQGSDECHWYMLSVLYACIPIADVPGSVINLVEIYNNFATQFPLPSPKMPAFSCIRADKLMTLTQQM